jgi:hypothetical protein
VSTSVRDRLATASITQARLAGWLALLAFMAARLVRVGGLGGLPVAGGADIHPGVPAELKIGPHGYDGQFVYRLAIDPFTRAVTAHGISLDTAGYRQQRIMTAVFAHLLAELPGVGVAAGIALVNVAAVAVGIWVGTAFAADVGRNPIWGLVLAIPACMPISLGRDLTEPVAWAGALAGIWFVRRRRFGWAALALTVGVLARETTLVIIVGLLLGAGWDLVRHRRGATWRAAWLLAPIAIAAGWQIWLWHVWGALPIRAGQNNTGSLPLVGPFGSLLYGLVGTHANSVAIGAVYALERVAELGLLAAAAWLIVRRRTTASAPETAAWVLAALLAFSVRSWRTDYAFLRATYEAWGLSVLVVLQARWAPAAILGGAGAVTIGVAAVYLYVT